MPGMFSRRRASSAQRPVNQSTASAAATAATQAYINRSSRSASLSSAAAAAALRSHATTPDPVGDVVTKRMSRRTSISSNTSGNGHTGGAPARGGLQRTNSSGSMTERTFRAASPSPNRANSVASATTNATQPPVPPLPKTLRSGGNQRPGSTEPSPRVLSPPMPKSMRSASVDNPGFTKSRSTRDSNRLSQLYGSKSRDESPSNRFSVNFSRPRMTSPEPSPTTQSAPSKKIHTSGGWHGSPVGSAQAASSASHKPSPLQTTSNAASELEEVMTYDANSRTFVKSTRPKPKVVEPPSPIVDNATPLKPLKPGDYDPATRSIVPKPTPSRTTSADNVNSMPPSPAANRSVSNPMESIQTQRDQPRPASDKPVAASPRPSGLHKQPSIVREDPDAERAAEEAVSPTARNNATTNAQTATTPSKSYAPASQHQRSVSLDVPQKTGDRGRGGSLSPSRSARFSASPVVQNVLHEPHRGISPAKSAMKHSPSSSLRTASPVATFSPTPALQTGTSDVSDTTSLASADGSVIGHKKRKSVRVSWDDGTSVPPVPELAKETPGSIPKSARVHDLTSDDEADDYTKPRPVLPSFGSVRRDKTQSGTDEDNSDNTPKTRVEAMTNGVWSSSNNPIPPEVRNTEATEPNLVHNDSHIDVPTEHAVDQDTSASIALPTAAPTQVAKAKKEQDEVVPAINFQPPTPGFDEIDRELVTDDEAPGMSESQELRALAHDFVVYGDESDTSTYRMKPTAPLPMPRRDSDHDVYSDAPETQDAGGPQGYASLDAIVESPVASPTRTTAPDSALTAVPESPTAVTQPDQEEGVDWTAASAHWSQVNEQQKAQAQQAQLSSGDERKTKRSFFRRNKQKKEAKKERDLASSPTPTPLIIPATTAPQEDRAVSPVATPTKSVPHPAQAQPLKSALKTSTSPADDSFHLPQTMRDSGVSTTNKTQTSVQRPNGNRPASVGHSGAAQRVSSSDIVPGSRRFSHQDTSSATAAAPSSKLMKKSKDDSDSDTSFKKKRRPSSSVGAQGKYTMRRSMRAGSIDSTQRVSSPPPSTGRSMSPMSDSGREGKAASIRQSLRGGPPNAGTRTLRGMSAPKQSKPARPASSSGFASKFKSRLVDSDDSDDDARPATRPTYRSRFVDSDDDDTIAEELTPVRGIPRRKGREDGDSTDLEDESDAPGSPSKRKSRAAPAIVTTEADIEKAMELARKKLGIPEQGAKASQPAQANGQNALRRDGRNREDDKVLIPSDVMSDAGSEHTAGKKKRGFMRGLLGRNRHSSQSVQRVGRAESPAPPMPTIASPTSTPQKSQTPASPTGAKLVRRNSQPPKLGRENSGFSTNTAPAASSPNATNKEIENWPLPPPIPQDKFDTFSSRDTGRPQTSDDGVFANRTAERPQNRRSFSARVGFTEDAVADSEKAESEAGSTTVFSQRTGRKKKFGLLRRAFGLHD